MSDSTTQPQLVTSPAGAPNGSYTGPVNGRFVQGRRILIKDQPMGLYLPAMKAHGENRYGKRCSDLFKRCSAKAKGDEALSLQDLRELRYFPEAYRSLALFPMTRGLVIDDVMSVPKVAVDLIIHEYEQAKEYETALFCYPEEIFRLMVWGRSSGTTLKYPPSLYLSLLLEDITWAVRWYKETLDDNYALQITSHIEDNFEYDSGSACLYLRLNPEESAQPYQNVLRENGKYAYIASRLFEQRGLNVSALSYDWLSYPQWAYHFLRDFRDQIDVPKAEHALTEEPLWLAEYLLENPHPKARDLCEECIHDNPDHPLLGDLREWMAQTLGT